MGVVAKLIPLSLLFAFGSEAVLDRRVEFVRASWSVEDVLMPDRNKFKTVSQLNWNGNDQGDGLPSSIRFQITAKHKWITAMQTIQLWWYNAVKRHWNDWRAGDGIRSGKITKETIAWARLQFFYAGRDN